MSEPITGELRRKMDTLGWYDEDGSIVFTTSDLPAGEMACLVLNSKTFGELCDAIDAIHANLERENDRLKCELDRVLGELDEMHKTDGISDNSGGFMHDEKRSIGSAVVTITPTLDWMGVARELRSIADTLVGDVS